MREIKFSVTGAALSVGMFVVFLIGSFFAYIGWKNPQIAEALLSVGLNDLTFAHILFLVLLSKW